jgi:hypothetical protein
MQLGGQQGPLGAPLLLQAARAELLRQLSAHGPFKGCEELLCNRLAIDVCQHTSSRHRAAPRHAAAVHHTPASYKHLQVVAAAALPLTFDCATSHQAAAVLWLRGLHVRQSCISLTQNEMP